MHHVLRGVELCHSTLATEVVAPTVSPMESRFFILEKALYEIYYEAANRPDLLPVPVAGLAAFIQSALP